MKTAPLRPSCFSLLLLLLPLLPARTQLRIDAELRPRVLVDAGYGSLKLREEPVLGYVTQRTRLNALFTSGNWESYLSFQDVRLWGGDDRYQSSGSYGSTGSVSLHQGWFAVQATTRLYLKVGRQLFSYDDQRILSARNWNDYQVTYDAVLLKMEEGAHRLDLGLSWNSESKSLPGFPVQKFRTLDFLRYQRKGERYTWSAIALLTGNTRGDTLEGIRYRATWGSNLEMERGPFQGRGSLYYQHHLNQAGNPVSAWSASLRLGSALAEDRLTWKAGVDVISGQDDLRSGDYAEKEHAFDLLYGGRHGFFGYMDYFSNMPAQGLQDYLVELEYSPGGGVSLKADYHWFWLAAEMADPESQGLTLNKRLGDELDLTVNWVVSDIAKLQAGYSFFVPRPTLEVLKDVSGQDLRFPQFVYLMITIKPGFQFASSRQEGPQQ